MEDLLRHTLATVAYRGGKALRGAPMEFADYRAAETSGAAGKVVRPWRRTPGSQAQDDAPFRGRGRREAVSR